MPIFSQYIEAESTGAFVSPTVTFSREFPTYDLYVWYRPYLEMWVKTGYSSSQQSATVRVNGYQIGTISPRPWLTHNYVDYESVSFFFWGNFLRAITFSSSGQPVYNKNTLEVVVPPGNTGYEYVLLGPVICHYRGYQP
jgi:hypothetical protein